MRLCFSSDREMGRERERRDTIRVQSNLSIPEEMRMQVGFSAERVCVAGNPNVDINVEFLMDSQ